MSPLGVHPGGGPPASAVRAASFARSVVSKPGQAPHSRRLSAGCLKPDAPLLARVVFVLKPDAPLLVRVLLVVKPLAPLSVRNGRFCALFAGSGVVGFACGPGGAGGGVVGFACGPGGAVSGVAGFVCGLGGAVSGAVGFVCGLGGAVSGVVGFVCPSRAAGRGSWSAMPISRAHPGPETEGAMAVGAACGCLAQGLFNGLSARFRLL